MSLWLQRLPDVTLRKSQNGVHGSRKNRETQEKNRITCHPISGYSRNGKALVCTNLPQKSIVQTRTTCLQGDYLLDLPCMQKHGSKHRNGAINRAAARVDLCIFPVYDGSWTQFTDNSPKISAYCGTTRCHSNCAIICRLRASVQCVPGSWHAPSGRHMPHVPVASTGLH